MKKDEYLIGHTSRYIAMPKTYAVWDTQAQCWVATTDNTDKEQVQKCASKFNEWNNKTLTTQS